MKQYEIMFIIKPELEEAQINETAEEMKQLAEKNGAKNIELKAMGQKKLAYEVKKYKTGYYFLITFETEKHEVISEFDRLALINDNIIRHLIVRVDE